MGRTAQQAVRRANKMTSKELANALFNGQDLGSKGMHYSVYTAKEIQPQSRMQIMRICRENMKDLYDRTPGGWNEEEKENELFDSDARFIIVNTAMEQEHIAAFINWRFDVEVCEKSDACARSDQDVVEVAYCYELQVDRTHRRFGLGTCLMQMLYNIACHAQMRKVMLTVFEANEAALTFYHRMDYVVDAISPSHYAEIDEEDPMGEYKIMSKPIVP